MNVGSAQLPQKKRYNYSNRNKRSQEFIICILLFICMSSHNIYAVKESGYEHCGGCNWMQVSEKTNTQHLRQDT